MKIFRFFCIFIFFNLVIPFYSYDFIATARSIAFGGAYSSTVDSFEALAYNPAGIYMTNKRMGFDILGTYSARFFIQYFSTQSGINILHAINERETINNFIPEISQKELSFGINTTFLTMASYINFDKFGVGLFLKNKQFFYLTLDSGLFDIISDGLNIVDDKKSSFFIKGVILDYLDFGFSLSTRLRFLEKLMKIQKIYVGLTSHFYLPLYFAELNVNGSIFTDKHTIYPNEDPNGSKGIAAGVNNYIVGTNGYVRNSSFFLRTITNGLLNFDSESPTAPFFDKTSGGGDFGLGFDFGFTLVFNQYVKVGFAINDIGFIIFPQSSKGTIDTNEKIFGIEKESGEDLTIVAGNPLDILKINESKKDIFTMISPLSMRTGISFNPVYNRYFDLILALDISVSDFYKITFDGYPTFAVATGIEFSPKFGWFRMPIITAFNFNTESLGPSFSFGMGLHLGPVKMMIGIKGLEGLIEGYGSNDLAIGFDLKFEF